RGSAEFTRRGMELLRRAIERDPGFARALAELAAQNVTLTFYGSPDALADAERHAQAALALEPTLAAALSVLGMTRAVRRRWLEAHASFQASHELEGDDLFGHAYSVFLTASVGHVRKAVAKLRAEHARSPAATMIPALLAAGLTALPL